MFSSVRKLHFSLMPCQVILLSTARNPSEESWLTAVKSLGDWFGKVTIARKRRIQDTELDLKSLILEVGSLIIFIQ